ncbi:hypothetical protein BJY04DRAFT_179797 [Aspergillus karnatakaensis]|uniref:uncharacterized protein n=1 Tax=Aspergillus karnatakaensis TaxID=1810916 RepID=UPI003CCCA9AC
MSEIVSSEILISDLPTKEVTLAPQQVTIVREISTTIQPGQNEITILGLDPRVNRDSIRIEGSGHATITDIQTSVVRNREDYSDVSNSESDSEDDSDNEDNESLLPEDEDCLDDPELYEIYTQIAQVSQRLEMARNDINASNAVLTLLNGYGKGLTSDENKDLGKFEEFLNVYSTRRVEEAERHHSATVEVNTRERELAQLKKKFEKRKTRYLKERRAASKAIRVRKEERAKARALKQKQLEQKRIQRRSFWKPNVGQIVVSLDSHTAVFTPGSSRRSSLVEKAVETPATSEKQEPIDVMLRLSYIVPVKSWSSRYELRMNSPSSTARMTYRADFGNTSTETWRDARVTLSTSQASFSGIGARIPSLDPWNIKIVTADSKAPSWDRILDAPKSSLGPVPPPFPKPSLFGAPAPQVQKGGGLFGNTNNVNNENVQLAKPQSFAAQNNIAKPPFLGPQINNAGALFGARGPPPPPPPPGLNGAVPQVPVSFGQSSTMPPPDNAQDDLFGSDPASTSTAAQPSSGLFGSGTSPSDFGKELSTAVELEDDDADTQTLAGVSLEHQDSIRQEYGMTTTYELPGRRTLTPSWVSRRHVLAELDLKNVTLTYMIVPKHKEAAFLRARIKNTSSLTLHPGPVGVTVDGSFVGAASLDTCRPNVFFNISLGIDPGIQVKYAKPTVKPLTGAMFFNKEDGAKFRRSCWVKNSKGVAVDIIITDQIPISDDEKLRVKMLHPDLEKEGDEVPLQMAKRVGAGKASFLKNGQVKWNLKLEPGQEIRLVLEYETKVPSGSDVAAA